MSDFTDKVRQKREAEAAKQEQSKRQTDLIDAVKASSEATRREIAAAVRESQPDTKPLAKSDDISAVTNAIHQMNLTTFLVGKDNWFNDFVDNLANLNKMMQSVMDDFSERGVKNVEQTFSKAITDLDKTVSRLESIKVESDKDQVSAIRELREALSKIDYKPTIKVPEPKVTVKGGDVDFAPLTAVLEGIQKGLDGLSKAQPNLDTSDLKDGLSEIHSAIEKLIAKPIPVAETPLPFKNTSNQGVQPTAVTSSSDSTKTGIVVLNPDGSNISGGGGGGAGTEYTEDAASTADPVGGTLILRRRDTLTASEVSADGDNIAANATSRGQLHVKQADYSTSGTLSSATSVTTDLLDNFNSVHVAISGTWTATLQFEASVDGTNYSAIYGMSSPATYGNTTITPLTSTTTNRRLVFALGDWKYFRVRASSYTSGTVNVSIGASQGRIDLNVSQVLGADSALALRPLPINPSADGESSGVYGVDTRTFNHVQGSGGWNRQKEAANGTNSTGTGITAAGILAQFDDTSPTTITENQFGNVRMSANRNLYGTIRDAAGNERGANVNASNELLTSASVTAMIPGTGATNLGKAEDAAHTSGDTGVMGLGVRNDAATVFAGTDGDYTPEARTGEGYSQVASGWKEVSFTTTTVQAVGTTEVGNYRWVSVHIVTQGTSSTVAFQGSNDNTNWVSVALQQTSAVGGTSAVTSTTSASVIMAGPINFRYFRLNVTGISAGTTAGVIEFMAMPSAVAMPGGNTNQTVNINQVSGAAVSTVSSGVMRVATHLEDAGHASGDPGVFVMGVRNDAQTTLTNADADYSPVATDGAGNLRLVGNVDSAATDAGSPVKAGARYDSTPPTYTNGQRTNLQSGSRGSLSVQLMVPDSSTQVTFASAADGATNPSVASRLENISRTTVYNGSTWDRMRGDTTGTYTVAKPTTSGGLTMHKTISAASTNATSVKGSAGQLYGIQVYNTNASARYLKLYNKASAPTVGTDTPVKVITIPGNAAGGGSNVTFGDLGAAFGTGIAFALTTGAADSDTGAVAANEIIVNLDYS